ncbi:DMT family transporter [Streptomyces marispadix]|uniref:DMT family transporter n=1 Tax=Streptomyces marispadix TaxID=2922868 RepID=A0ABS9SRQ6_9ACTN|nr:DMT family transporter [Streptomyces marispadix]MCH6158973.1 DMT family transporter [Streptomyces marispadix]
MDIPPGSSVNALLAAVLLSLVSAVCYATAAIVQERLAATTPPSRYGLLRSPRWWGAVALNSLGAVLHVGALGLGPLTVVQPLGVLTLVLAAPLAALLVKRPVSAAAWHGIVLVSGGLAVLLVLTGSTPARGLAGTEQLTLAVAVAGVLATLLLTATTVGRRARMLRSVALAATAGVAYGTASVFIKTVADNWTPSLPGLLTALPLLALIGLLAAGGLAASQSSYRGGGLAAPLATMTVVNPAFAAAVGIVLLGEGFRFGALGAAGAAVAALVTAWGLVVLSADSAGHPLRRRPAPRRVPVEGPGPVVVRAPGRLSGAMHQVVVRRPHPLRERSRTPASRH